MLLHNEFISTYYEKLTISLDQKLIVWLEYYAGAVVLISVALPRKLRFTIHRRGLKDTDPSFYINLHHMGQCNHHQKPTQKEEASFTC